MSRSAINNAWTKDLRETLNVRKATKEKIKSDGSRENSSSRKRTRPNEKADAEIKQASKPKKPLELETDPSILQRRQKQIDYGKNTVGYHNYLEHVPLDKRTKEDPKTPDKYSKYSRRSWDMLIKMWRKKLHEYDTDGAKGDGSYPGSISGSNTYSDEEEEDTDIASQ